MHMRVLGWLPVQNKFDAAELEELRELKNDIERKDKQQAGIIENQVRCQMLRARTHKHTHTHYGRTTQAGTHAHIWDTATLALGFLCTVSANSPIGSAAPTGLLVLCVGQCAHWVCNLRSYPEQRRSTPAIAVSLSRSFVPTRPSLPPPSVPLWRTASMLAMPASR